MKFFPVQPSKNTKTTFPDLFKRLRDSLYQFYVFVVSIFSTTYMRIALLCMLISWSASVNQLYAQNQPSQPTTTALSPKQQSIVSIASLTAKGDLQKLQTALTTGLDAGLTVNEIKEVLVHLYAYCGFPRSIRGLQTFMSVLDERKKRGITDKMGRKASPITSSKPKYERGKKVLEQLSGQPETGPKRGYSAFSPEIEVFLKEHLFADLFERDVLSYTDRELTTISVLTSIGGAEPMLQSHLGICLHLGLTGHQLEQVMALIATNVGKSEAEAGRLVLTQVRAARR
ncbi:carboxymuconolactone decarboxylase family protein [Spirosoma luteum]|uniref:carboxymuconolactone decarboxylase family protein n=1 Tax=Spirosoma luteum TaxID=431553 RepID=UPI00037C0B4D|nr:carboxymuconolactone decarboxylase family protein [Spirosoma luteum]